MKVLLTLLLLVTALATATGQDKWKIDVGADIEYNTSSPDGNRLLYLVEDGDNAIATCVNTQTGQKLWTRTLEEFDRYPLCRFVNNDTVLLGQKRQFEFLNAESGGVLATIPIADESWDDLKLKPAPDAEHDSLTPYIDGDIGVFYFYRAMQILDLKNLSVIYQTGWSPNSLKYYRWGPALMINPKGGGDTIYFLDVSKRKMIYKVSSYDSDINSSVYQPFAATTSELLLFNEKNIESIDMATGAKNATIPVDPDDPEYYSPVIFKDALYLMVSDDDVQKMYRTKDGVLLWQSEPGAIKGIVEQVIELPKDEALLFAYDPDGITSAMKVSTSTGKIAWKRPLFVQDGKLDPGHKEGSRFLATLATIAVVAVRSYLGVGSGGGYSYRPMSSSYIDPRTGLIETRGSTFPDINEEREARRRMEEQKKFINDTFNSWVNKRKVTPGYVQVVTQNDEQLSLALVGRIYEPVKGDDADDYNGEAMLTLKVADGSVVQSRPFEMLAKSDSKAFNAFRDMHMITFGETRVLVGVHDIYVVRGQQVERVTFGEDKVKLLDSSLTSITFHVNHDDGDRFDYWRYDVGGPETKRMLIARSEYANVVFIDTVAPATTIRFTPDLIEAFPLVTGEATDASFASPKWKLSEAELDKMDFGDLDENVSTDTVTQGIAVVGGDVFFLGDDGIGFVSGDGSCRWSHEWSPNMLQQHLGLTKVGNAVAYSMGSYTKVYGTPCPGAEIGAHDISFSDSQVRLSETGTLLVIDTDDNIINGYVLKK